MFGICNASFNTSCSPNSTQMIPRTLKMSQPLLVPGIKAASRSLILHLQPSMCLVIRAGLVACAINTFVHVHSGRTFMHTMIACSSTLIGILKECKDSMLRESCVSSHFTTTGPSVLVLSSSGSTKLVTVQMKLLACGWCN